MRILVAAFAVFFSAQSCFAWFDCGHHVIAELAFDLLKPELKKELIEVLKSHPRFAEDFALPENFTDQKQIDRWLIGRAGYWPDVARGGSYDRPTWHYQLGATLTLHEPKGVPMPPGPLPADATLDSTDLYISQAIELCRAVWKDRSRTKEDRALALCWLAHLVADSHQPCHAGSLYTAVAFPGGDRGANGIQTKQMTNLHALWDGLLGAKFDASDVRRRRREILSQRELMGDAKKATYADGGLDPHTWLAESSELGRMYVYAPEVVSQIEAVERGLVANLGMIDLSEDYLKAAGELAQKRAAYAAYRLAVIYAEVDLDK